MGDFAMGTLDDRIADDLVIREASTPEDFARATALIEGYPEDQPHEDDSRRYAGCPGSQRVHWVAELDGEILGCASVVYDRSRVWVSAMVVDPAFRGLGVGTMLMAWAEHLGKLNRLSHVTVPCFRYSDAAKICEHWGMERSPNPMISQDGRQADLWLRWL
jgi:GNAT superfamily N-acetyltransferase